MIKARQKRIPEDIYGRVNKLGNIIKIPTTKAWLVREKFMMGDITEGRLVKKKGKRYAEFKIEI